jgi:hypothetical protein
LVWTMTTNGYKFYTWNLYVWCESIGIKLCILCADTESSLFFRREGIPSVLLETAKQSKQIGISAFGSADFSRWNRVKVDLLFSIANASSALGIRQSLFLDGDIVIKENPWPVLQACFDATGATLLFQCDCSHQQEHHTCNAPCTGVIACHHEQEKDSVQWLYSFVQEEWNAADQQDQPYIQRRLERPLAPRAAILPRREFGNGMWQKSGYWKDGSWILLHYNYRVGDTKKMAMRTAGHWKLAV